MKKNLQSKLTYANTIATLALFVALGGSAYAATQPRKNSVGAKQIRANSITTTKIRAGAVTAAKVREGSLTGADIQASTLGKVPAAQNAEQLAGSPPSAFRNGCPATTTLAAADLCVTNSDVGPFSGADTLAGAITDCGKLGLRLPSPAEAQLLIARTPDGTYWTDDFWTDTTAAGGPTFALAFKHDPEFSEGALITNPSPTKLSVRCVTTPSQP